MIWLIWGLLLILQNASFTLVSRARNSNSLGYHALAGLGSNGIWFLSQFILFDKMIGAMSDAALEGDYSAAITIGIFYTVCTLAGSLGMHWLALRKIEKRIETR